MRVTNSTTRRIKIQKRSSSSSRSKGREGDYNGVYKMVVNDDDDDGGGGVGGGGQSSGST